MKRIPFSLLLITTVQIVSAVNFSASAPSEVEVGREFSVTYSIDADGRDFRAPDMSAFEVVAGPLVLNTPNFAVVNGKMVSSVNLSYTYNLKPKKEGTFKLGAASISVEQQTFKSNSLTITVSPVEKTVSASSSAATPRTGAPQPQDIQENITDENLFVRVIPSKARLYEQDCLLLTYKLYSLVNLLKYGNEKLPDYNGFLKQNIEAAPNPKQLSMENYNGKNYSTLIIYQTLLFPQKTGNIRIEKAFFDVVVRMDNKNQSRNIFDSFLGMFQEEHRILTAPAITIAVDRLPEPKPADFSGAVGSFTVESSVTARQVATNDPVTLKYTINGTGNLKLIRNPQVEFPAEFEVYDPTVTYDLQNTVSGVTGSKTVEYLLIPRAEGDFIIPNYTFSYFDINTQTYKTVAIPECSIHVEKGTGSNQTAFTESREQLKQFDTDIRFIHTGKISVREKGSYFFGSLAFWLWYVLSLIVAAVLFVFLRKYVKANADVLYVRNRRANNVAIKRLTKAKEYMENDNSEAFYEETLRALWGYVSDKLAISLSTLSKDNVQEELKKKEIDRADIDEFTDILSVCEFARYAPSTNGQQQMDNLYERTLAVITKFQETIK